VTSGACSFVGNLPNACNAVGTIFIKIKKEIRTYLREYKFKGKGDP
jgi:hypothetical protein